MKKLLFVAATLAFIGVAFAQQEKPAQCTDKSAKKECCKDKKGDKCSKKEKKSNMQGKNMQEKS